MSVRLRVIKAAVQGVMLVVLAGTLACKRTNSRFTVSDAWARFASDTGVTTAAYFTLHNGLARDVMVADFRSDAARAVELHESMQGDHMMMHMVPRTELRVPAHSSVTLKPGGLHLMLIGTTRPLRAGDLVWITMRLSDSTVVSTTARVRAP